MKLLQSIANLLTVQRSSTPATPLAQAWLRGEDLEAGSQRLTAPYTQSAWVYVAVSVLAESLAHVPFRISRGRGKGETILDSGPAWNLFQHPHPSMSRTLFWQTLVSWEALRGEFFVVPMDKDGCPVALARRGGHPVYMMPLNPDCFTHIIEENRIAGWAYKAASPDAPMAERVLLAEEVIHCRNFNPYQFWRGVSPLSVAMLPAVSDYAAEQFMKGLMMNNGDAGLVVTTEEMLDETQREQFRAALLERKRRAGTADRPLFLWGKAKIEQPSLSSVDTQFLENRKLNRQEIGAVFKVPESMMGFAGQKNALSAGTAIEQDRLNFIQNTIGGICRRLESAMEPVIKSFDSSLNGWFDLDALPIMQAARRDRMATAHQAFSMGVPFNEINQVYDLGFESLPWGDKGYLASSLGEVGDMQSKKNACSVVDSKPADPCLRLVELLESSEIRTGTDSPDAGWRQSSVKAKAGKLSRFLFEQRGRVLASLESACVGMERGEMARLDGVFNREVEDELLKFRLKPLVVEDARKVQGETSNPGCDEWIAPVLARLDSLNRTTELEIVQALEEGVACGEGAEALAARVKAVFNGLAGRVTERAESLTMRGVAAD
jgi:HK97 family phage portal protein